MRARLEAASKEPLVGLPQAQLVRAPVLAAQAPVAQVLSPQVRLVQAWLAPEPLEVRRQPGEPVPQGAGAPPWRPIPWPTCPFRPERLRLLRQQPNRGNACEPFPQPPDQSNSNASSSR